MATNAPITGSVRPVPRQPALGAIARALASAHQFASRPFGYNNPPGEASAACWADKVKW